MTLRGRLEHVYIEKNISDKVSIGYFQGTTVVINNGTRCIGDDCLARFDLYPKNPEMDPIGNFITSHIPPHFEGLNNFEYILLGLWGSYMKKVRWSPTLKEINIYYDPGDMFISYYLAQDSSTKKGRIKIMPDSQIPLHMTIPYIIKRGFNNARCSRVIITESKESLEKLISEITEVELVPILMEPIL